MDINLIRENPEVVKESQRRRFKSVLLVDEVKMLDELWRKATYSVEQTRREINEIQDKITALYKAGKKEDAKELEIKKKQKQETVAVEERVVEELKQQLDAKLACIGNIVHDSVPVSNDEAHNEVVKRWGNVREHSDKLYAHHQLLYMLDGFDPKAGADIAGHRGYFLKGVGVLLNQAIINLGLHFLEKKGFTLLQTPYFMNKSIMGLTAQLSDFDEQLYKVYTGSSRDKDDDPDKEKEKYLIATSEQPISAFHMGQWIAPADLPKRYAGYSTNFRKEAGGHGRDVWGIFRVHQFEKIEQFCITEPDKSWEMHEEMLRTAEEFYQALEIPYRVVNIVSGELNDAAAKKYDLEGWFPGMNEYRELVSCSNCTDFQSRRLDITTGTRSKDEASGKRSAKTYVHMLNSTLCATTRTICAILENYQEEKGVRVPKVLQPYLGGRDFLEFKNPPPVYEEPSAAAKAKGGASKGGKGGKAAKK